MKHRVTGLLVAWALACLVSAPTAFAQSGATSSISGTVVDTAGGAIPGVTVIVKNDAGTTFETVTNAQGVFSVPALAAGTYTITVSLTGFKTAVVPDVRVQPGTPASVQVKLEVGQLEETVTVTSSSELINTQTPTVSSTLNSDQLNRMPTPTRNALNAVTFLPGINTATTNRESRINGLPESFVSITLDGVSNNDNFLRSSDSFFASVTPRQDAIEAVTVTTAAAPSSVGGSGAVTINFATRSGTNRLSGSAYEYWRDPSLNSNYWFNERDGLEKNDVKLNQYGGRIGGPIVIPGLFNGRDKAFFFFHYEQLKFPNSFTRTRNVLHPDALNGTFRYSSGGQVRQVNVLDLARSNGQISAIDPTVQDLLGKIQAATGTTGAVTPTSDPLVNQYVWLSPGKLFEHQPTLRIDFNITDKHRLSGSTQTIWAERDPDYLNAVDARFPGAPNYRFFHSKRPLHSITLRSTLTSNIVNELRGGITALGGASYFGDNSSNGPQTFEDQGGYAIDFDNAIGLTNWFATNSPSWRSAPTISIDNTMSWQRGKHSINIGGSVLLARAWENAQQMVPGINLQFNTANDPAAGMFGAANFPNATAAQLSDARDLYALLTGRVNAVTGQAALDPDTNQYVAFGPRRREGTINMYSLFTQDSWRITPALTLNAGLRWDVQLPFTPVNDIMSNVTMASVCGISGLGGGGTYDRCNFFQPGASGGVTPEFIQLTRGTQGYETDWNNIAPNVGVAWRPNVQEGWLRTLLGDPEQATIRAGYSVAYDRQGMGIFTGEFGANPGSTLSLSRDQGTGLVPPGESWPVLLSQKDRLFNASFPDSASFPIAIRPNRADDINTFAPDIRIASAGTWTIGLQRSISRDMAIDVRYVGTRGWNQWSELNYNTIRGENLINNGFLDEFRLAMNNLNANNIAGGNRAGSFAYFGPNSGTSPLPIYLAYLNGSRDHGTPGAYSGSSWTNTAITEDLVRTNPSPVDSAADLDDNLTRRTAARNAGLPANFFIPNPDIDDVNVTDSGAFSDYHALQIELRRRLSKGLSANVNYQYAVEAGSAFDGFRFGRTMIPSENVRHAIKTQWDWTIPVGRGQRFGTTLNPVLDGILGGWSFNGVGRIQARVIDFGNVRLVGMSVDELTDMYKFDIRTNPDTGLQTVYMLPDDVILNTRRAFSVSTTSMTGYSSLGVPEGRYIAPDDSFDCLEIKNGDCAPRTLLVRAPWFTRFDIGVTKRFPIHGSVNFEVRFDLLNVFNNINFNPFTDTIDDDEEIFQTDSAYTDASNTYDPGGRLGQVMFRINW
jgi:Carboxypeptidase regulatory-like domain/TonB dependent receptor/TonB-dependent Receptor Plug Domain